MGYGFQSPETDYPELNKCPDCETFFQGERCPLCGRECPEEMRAGNRKKFKPAKPQRGGSDRVQFVAWYYSPLFVLLMFCVMPIVGIILFYTAPYKKGVKIGVTIALVAIVFLVPFCLTLYSFLNGMKGRDPVDRTLKPEAYREVCDAGVSAEDLYRNANAMDGNLVEKEFRIVHIWENYPFGYDDSFNIFYEVTVAEDGEEWRFLIMDCRNGETEVTTLRDGDAIRVWGEVVPRITVENDSLGTLTLPGIRARFIEYVP